MLSRLKVLGGGKVERMVRCIIVAEDIDACTRELVYMHSDHVDRLGYHFFIILHAYLSYFLTSDLTSPRSSSLLLLQTTQCQAPAWPRIPKPIRSRCRNSRRDIATPRSFRSRLTCISISRQPKCQICILRPLALVKHLIHVFLHHIWRPYRANECVSDLVVVCQQKHGDGLVEIDVRDVVLLIEVFNSGLWSELCGWCRCLELELAWSRMLWWLGEGHAIRGRHTRSSTRRSTVGRCSTVGCCSNGFRRGC